MIKSYSWLQKKKIRSRDLVLWTDKQIFMKAFLDKKAYCRKIHINVKKHKSDLQMWIWISYSFYAVYV